MLQARRAKRCGECRLDFETTIVARRHLDTGRGRWVIRACDTCTARLAAKYPDGSMTLTRIDGLDPPPVNSSGYAGGRGEEAS